MKKAFIICIMMLVFTNTACVQKENVSESVEVNMEKYYTMEDFQSIVIGESTLDDVDKIAPMNSLQVTAEGFMYRYPMEDGRYICIKFFGKELIVSSITIHPWYWSG